MTAIANVLFKGSESVLKDHQLRTLKKKINNWLTEYIFIIAQFDLSRFETPKSQNDRNCSRFCIVQNQEAIGELIKSAIKCSIPAISPSKENRELILSQCWDVFVEALANVNNDIITVIDETLLDIWNHLCMLAVSGLSLIHI